MSICAYSFQACIRMNPDECCLLVVQQIESYTATILRRIMINDNTTTQEGWRAGGSELPGNDLFKILNLKS
jgi:hypothetical protein